MNFSLKENIHWVGYVDWTVRDFHGYQTGRGSTYNAYLVRDKKTALIDTVKAPFARNLLRNVSELTALDKIDYIVCNHAEPDHSGSLPDVVGACPQAEIVCNKKCQDTLGRHFDVSNWKFRVIANGDSLSLGDRTLSFLDTPMAHWPESMFTYVPEEKLLFSMDGFGQHYASSGRFDDQEPLDVVMHEAKKYYANILMPYGKQVSAVMDRASGLEIEIIAPSHGVIWRKHIGAILEGYRDWVLCRPRPKVLVIYDTMWHSTEAMAQAMQEGATRDGVEVQLLSIRKSHLTIFAQEIIDAAAVAIGTPTLNRTMMPQVGALLTYLKGLRPVGKAALAFGSYGWAKGGAKDVNAALEDMKFEILMDPIQSRFTPTKEVLDECFQAGRKLSERAIEIAESFGN